MPTGDGLASGRVLHLYPVTDEAFSVTSDGRGRFLIFTSGASIDLANSTVNGRTWDFAASNRGGGVWRIDRVAGSAEPPGGGTDTSPSFDGVGGPGNRTYAVGTATGALTYSPAPDVPGLTFDPAGRRLSGTPTAAGSYDMTYTATDADGDSDSLGFTVVVEASAGGGVAAADFDLDDDNRIPRGIAFANRRFHVVDYVDEKVYAYTASGQRDAAADFYLDANNGLPEGIAFANGRFYVVDRSGGKVYAYAGDETGPPRFANGPGNQFYTVSTLIGALTFPTASGGFGTLIYSLTPSVTGLTFDPAARRLSGTPAQAGTYDMTYTVTDADGGTDSLTFTITVTEPAPDLVVESASVSDSSPDAGQSFTLRATVRNGGGASSAATTLRYYRSSNSTISTSDTATGTDSVSGLPASGTSAESVSLTAPSSAGTYYYGACVDTVAGESDTDNNCSTGVRVTVGGGSGPAVTATLTGCQGSRNPVVPGSVSVTMSGTVRANRAVSSITITGSANGSFVGIESITAMSAGESRSSTIFGTIFTTGTTLNCNADLQWIEFRPTGSSDPIQTGLMGETL